MARAKSLLERAAATGHLPAVYLLVDLLDREGATVRAIELLQRQLEGTSIATLHQPQCPVRRHIRLGPNTALGRARV